MDDLISRQAAIEAVEKESQIDGAYGYMDTKSIVDLLSDLPSAERRGRWVDSKRMGFDGTFHWFRQCSECLYEREDDNEDKDTPYCPHCGSRMDLGEEK